MEQSTPVCRYADMDSIASVAYGQQVWCIFRSVFVVRVFLDTFLNQKLCEYFQLHSHTE